ncbi:MAG: hypothetical protein FJ147_22880 [Deltaproteobacteria bacterium]|nr:hypothetical protein [Deltaproteobacteria bacterium]
MAKASSLVRKTVSLEKDKVQRLMKKLRVKSEAEAIRIVIDDRLAAEEVMDNIKRIRQRGTARDAYRRATRE